MKPEPSHNTDNRDIHWESFRYIAGEMSPSEVEAFELLLAEDQLAREAVAAAVEMTQAVSASYESQPVTPAGDLYTGSTFRSAWLGIALGSAACLFIMLGVQQVPQDNKQATENSQEQTDVLKPVDGSLAARWSELRERESQFDPWNVDALDDSVIEDSSSNFSDDEYSPAAPEWMMAAVSAAQKSQSMDDDMDMERSVDGPVEQ